MQDLNMVLNLNNYPLTLKLKPYNKNNKSIFNQYLGLLTKKGQRSKASSILNQLIINNRAINISIVKTIRKN